MLRIFLAGFHLLALGLGMLAVVARGSALRERPTVASLRRAFRMDTIWGIAAGLWVVTGLWRVLGSVEKPTAYYTANHLFMLKMTLFALIVVLEIWPMLVLIRWRIVLGRGGDPASLAAGPTGSRIAIISHIEALIVLVMIFVAAAMARGYGVTP